jgi:YD repeat-containing protein
MVLSGNGQISSAANPTPTQVTGLSGVTAVSAGGNHTVALKNDGTVWTWGYNGSGQLGNGTSTNSGTAAMIADLAGVIAISAGGDHTLALKSDGTVWTWGYNAQGQLGNGTTANSTLPKSLDSFSASAIPPCTITTSPLGQGIIVDGTSYTTPQTFHWTPGSSHTIAAAAVAPYLFASWSDGGP